MSVLPSLPDGEDLYYIPHHGVITSNSTQTKIRVVFDASAKAANDLSLNDCLYVGPKLQSTISTILLRFRSHEVVFTCDIRQMYRQILVAPEHRRFQLIRWRFAPSEPILTYSLNTVTYGVSSSPYLAIRTLIYLAEVYDRDFPLAADAIRDNTYVDDIICGAATVGDALTLQQQIIDLLKLGGFELRKWSANHPRLLRDISVDHQQHHGRIFEKSDEANSKILGLQWYPNSDYFSFNVIPHSGPCTKRTILSEIARIYDPLGFVCPVVFVAKYLIQLLWATGANWDDTPPQGICERWEQLKSELPTLSWIEIPRFVLVNNCADCQLHVFCDASEAGYTTVAYFRIVNNDGHVSTRLIMAKSKVAPLKKLSIPRLELSAAVLSSDIIQFVVRTYESSVDISQIFAWCDSTVALAWVRSSPHRWKTFVANRVVHIQERISPDRWRFVPSQENAADPASRGLLPEAMRSCSLWWAGPSWLVLDSNAWPVQPNICVEDPPLEQRAIVMTLVAEAATDFVYSLLNRFSSLRKIQGIVAYCFRLSPRQKILPGPLTEVELWNALMFLVRQVQAIEFSHEISQLRKGQLCSKPLRKLAAYLDDAGVLRVGGRLRYSQLTPEAKHPLLLPRSHRLTELLIRQLHEKHCHPGLNTTIHLLQQNFWILSARRAVKHFLSRCIRCFRVRPEALLPPMGDLPAPRITQVKPFSAVGGPFAIIPRRGRGVKPSKAYICVFICFATKAIHVELASDLSADTFLAVLRRFISRRGRCSHIFSDCGTNFVGASRELDRFMQTAAEAESITWHFNPPSAPHFGGLWEGGIKSTKTHLARVIGDQVLTYEELNTLLVQVEALLNSRPLTPLSADPNDLSALTPGHFLTLEPLSSFPDPDLSHLNISRLSRWQMVQYMHQHFWQRWHTEYLHTLQQRHKWATDPANATVAVGRLVLIREDNLLPLQWKLGRITSLHPGGDGLVRVASVLTSRGTFKRPLVKLCALPTS